MMCNYTSENPFHREAVESALPPSVIARDKREAFAQGSASDDLSAVAQRAKAEAIHLSARRAMDCFASLAMTKRRSHCDKSTRRANHPKVCPAPFAKIYRLTCRANQCSLFARLTADEGRVAIVTNVR